MSHNAEVLRRLMRPKPAYMQLGPSYLGVTFSKTKYAARNQRDLEFTITLDYVLDLLRKQQGKCALTGWDLEFTRGSETSRTNDLGCTMDRIDNDKGYVPGNIQLVCWCVNKMKGAFNDDAFRELCRQITEHTDQTKVVV